MELSDLVAATKLLVRSPEWVEREPDLRPGKLSFSAALEIDGATLAGLRLRGSAIASLPDAAVTFQLEYKLPARGQGGALSRIEWRPIAGHGNKGRGPPEFRHKVISGSHHHRFDLSWEHAPKRVRKGDPCIAVPMVPNPVGLEELEPRTYEELLAKVGKEFRINNIDLVPQPPWASEFSLDFQHDPAR